MADNEQDQPEKPLEGQGEVKNEPHIDTQEAEKTTSEAPEPVGDPFAMKAGEKPEDYAVRIRKEVEWRDKQLNRQHRQKKEADERLAKLAELEQQNKELQELATRAKKPASSSTTSYDAPSQPSQPSPPRTSPPPGVSPEALAAARFQVGMERLGEELNRRPEWPEAYKNLERAGSIPENIVRDVIDTDDPAHVMLKLGQDMGLYQQLLDMPEGRRRATLVKIGMETAKTEEKPAVRKPSAAPPPRQALPAGEGARAPEGQVDIYDPRLATEEHDSAWYAERTRQKRESQGRPWSPRR